MKSAAGVCLVAVLGATGIASGQEKAITRAELPPAVDSAVKVQSKGATLRGLSKERDKGQTLYEAELRVGGHKKDVLIDSSGAVVEVEEQVALDSLPVAVRMKLAAQAKPGRISRVESLSKNGRLVAYEAQVVDRKKKREIQVGPNGETLAHPE